MDLIGPMDHEPLLVMSLSNSSKRISPLQDPCSKLSWPSRNNQVIRNWKFHPSLLCRSQSIQLWSCS